jgi:hypothetical protein
MGVYGDRKGFLKQLFLVHDYKIPHGRVSPTKSEVGLPLGVMPGSGPDETPAGSDLILIRAASM